MFKVYKRGSGKNWQISYQIGGVVIRKTTKTNLFCNAILLCRHIEKEIEAHKRMKETRKHMEEKYLLAEKVMTGKAKSQQSIDGFNTFYLDSRDTPNSCNQDLGTVYVIKSGDLIKIGITQSPRERLRTIETGTGRKLDVIYLSKQCRNYRDVEKSAHVLFSNQRLLGEWFEADFRHIIYYFHEIQLDAPEPEPRIEVLRRATDRLCSQST